MPAKQGTLNKWFSGQNGSGPPKRPPAQQTTLAFKAKEDAQVDETEDTDMPDVNTSAEVKSETDAEAGSRERASAEESNEEDEGPVSKKRKAASTKSTSQSNGKSSNKRVKKSRSPSPTRSKPAATKTAAKKSSPKKSPEPAESDDEDVKIPTRKSSGPKEKAAVKIEEEDPATEEVKPADEEGSDEEAIKPEDAAKAREKILSALKGSGKDPYPDWKAGEPVPYAALCTTFHKIEMTTKRLEILAHCSLFLRQVLRLTPDDLLQTVLLMVNKLGADYVGIELGIGESLIMKAIGESTGRSLAVIKDDQKEIGDLGLVAAKSRGNQPTMFKPKPLTVRAVFKGLTDIATIEGQGAQGRKVAGIKKLLSSADAASAGKGKSVDITKDKGGPSEAKYIVRTLEGKLRLGLAEKSVLVAVSQAIVCHRAEYVAALEGKKPKLPTAEALSKGESIFKSVYSELPSYELIIPAIIKAEYKVDDLRDICKLRPGIPLKPMLAKPTKSITEVLDRFEGQHFTCEYKYDGERAQIHFVAHDSPEQYATAAPAVGKSSKGIANVFSRNSEDLSKKYPDILAKLPNWIKPTTKSFVLDCESVAWDTKEKKVLPFQQLQTRKRKDVKASDITVQVCVFAFDLLFLNGKPMVELPLRERRQALHDSFTPVEGEFAFASAGDAEDIDAIQVLLDESVKAGCEGLMVKMLDGPPASYEPSKRSHNWLKVKKDYLAGVGDSLDLVVLGAYFGKGKRTSWYGAFLLACYNPSTEAFETICNIGTGFSEVELAALHEQLSELVIDVPKPFYKHSSGTKDQPDVWFEPRTVWEVKTADLTVSPRYRAGEGEIDGVSGKGISLRFPRFVQERKDKKPEEATTSKAVAEMYRRQESVAKNKGPSVDDDFEY